MQSHLEINAFLNELEKEIQGYAETDVKADQLNRLQKLAESYTGEDEVVRSEDILAALDAQIEEHKIMTGFAGVDAILGGLRPNQLVVISAATKSGKTSFCVDLTSNMKAESPLWLPFEESASELLQKFRDRGETPPSFFVPKKMTGDTLQWIEKKIIESKAKYDSRVVFIDHLHFIIPFNSDRQDIAIGHAMRTLKTIAKTWNVTIVLVAHLKKTKVDIPPTLEDLRDSSFIAQEADTVIMLYRYTYKDAGEVVITNNVNVSIQANRRTGKTGNVKMVFTDGHFVEGDWKQAAFADDPNW